MDILELVNITATTATFYLGDGERSAEGYTIELYDSTQTTVVKTAVTDANGQATFKGLTPETTYYGYYSAAGYVQARTTADEPRTATETQWMDLAERVKDASAGGIKILTAADYDYPANNPDGIAIWNLESGIYAVDGVKVYYHSGRSNTVSGELLVDSSPTYGTVHYIVLQSNLGDIVEGSTLISDGTVVVIGNVLDTHNVQDNLTSTSTSLPLSANQGKVLAERIGDLTTLTTTAKTSLVAAVNELAGQSGGGAQADWSIIDSTSDAYIRNKPMENSLAYFSTQEGWQPWQAPTFTISPTTAQQLSGNAEKTAVAKLTFNGNNPASGQYIDWHAWDAAMEEEVPGWTEHYGHFSTSISGHDPSVHQWEGFRAYNADNVIEFIWGYYHDSMIETSETDRPAFVQSVTFDNGEIGTCGSVMTSVNANQTYFNFVLLGDLLVIHTSDSDYEPLFLSMSQPNGVFRRLDPAYIPLDPNVFEINAQGQITLKSNP